MKDKKNFENFLGCSNEPLSKEEGLQTFEHKKESAEEFSYDSLWNEEERKKEKKLLKKLPKGFPRTGIKGKWIKRKNHVTRNQIKGSYGSFIREERKKIESE